MSVVQVLILGLCISSGLASIVLKSAADRIAAEEAKKQQILVWQFHQIVQLYPDRYPAYSARHDWAGLLLLIGVLMAILTPFVW